MEIPDIRVPLNPPKWSRWVHTPIRFLVDKMRGRDTQRTLTDPSWGYDFSTDETLLCMCVCEVRIPFFFFLVCFLKQMKQRRRRKKTNFLKYNFFFFCLHRGAITFLNEASSSFAPNVKLHTWRAPRVMNRRVTPWIQMPITSHCPRLCGERMKVIQRIWKRKANRQRGAVYYNKMTFLTHLRKEMQNTIK